MSNSHGAAGPKAADTEATHGWALTLFSCWFGCLQPVIGGTRALAKPQLLAWISCGEGVGVSVKRFIRLRGVTRLPSGYLSV